MLEGEPVSAKPHHSEKCRLKAKNLAPENLRALKQLAPGELISRCSRPRGYVGDTQPKLEQLNVLRWVEQRRSEARRIERRPEAIARSGEVVPGRGAVQPGIDPAEQDAKARPDDVAQLAVNSILELFGRGTERVFHVEQCPARPGEIRCCGKSSESEVSRSGRPWTNRKIDQGPWSAGQPRNYLRPARSAVDRGLPTQGGLFQSNGSGTGSDLRPFASARSLFWLARLSASSCSKQPARDQLR